jgi:hypothetical protein
MLPSFCRTHWGALQGVCKKALKEMGVKTVWVPDLIGNLLPECDGLAKQAVGFKHIMAANSVHLTKHGYKKL